MSMLGLILLLIGLVFAVAVDRTIGVVFAVLGAVLLILGAA